MFNEVVGKENYPFRTVGLTEKEYRRLKDKLAIDVERASERQRCSELLARIKVLENVFIFARNIAGRL